MNLAREAIEFYRTDGRNWPQDQILHLIAVFGGGCPWKRETGSREASRPPRFSIGRSISSAFSPASQATPARRQDSEYVKGILQPQKTGDNGLLVS